MTQPNRYAALAAMVLAKCAAYDPYMPEVTEEQARAWGEQLELYGLDDSAIVMAAVTRVYSQNGSGYRPLPKDITDAARALRKDRADRETTDERQAREDRLDARDVLKMVEQENQRNYPMLADTIASFGNPSRPPARAGDRMADLVARQRAAGPPSPLPPEPLHRQHETTAEAEGHALQPVSREGDR